ncbi:MAG: M23 family metallopeptidase [Candidatus Aminicenantes bacterium]|nr:M23 family metallopeptidase [Candidatus Aminicenantes bacterium]
MDLRRSMRIACAALALLACACHQFDPGEPEESTHQKCLRRAVFGDPAFSAYVLPYPVGSSYRLLQSYCSGGSHLNQLAYDFYMIVGTPITAARAGTVLQSVDLYEDSDRDGRHVNFLMIGHADGSAAFYAHLRLGTQRVKVGEEVAQGQRIADSGHCGTPLPDLHFGVYRSWPAHSGDDLAINFRNADGPLDERGGLMVDVMYLALPY